MFGFSNNMNDMMNALFSDSAGDFGFESRSRRPKTVSLALPVTLSDLYNGKIIEVARSRKDPCIACDGRGFKGKRSGTCQACRGSGARVIVRQMGMMMQQMTVTCDVCGGEGRKIDPRDACSVCQGQRTIQTESPLSIEVERGMHHHEEFVFKGEGDWHPETGVRGDIVIVLEQVKDEQFVRDGDDLHLTHTITLAESLCGFQFVLKHLDGRELIVRRERGEITKPGEVKIVVGEGMPLLQRPGNCGDLVITFNVKFPARLEESQVHLLELGLPPPKSVDLHKHDDAEECYVSREELDNLRHELKDDMREAGPSVGCAAQ
ncbi:Heat shock protein DnaJ [Trypanosoma melophagium]|uniref:Heat shock protein DnaJ n=1 Tax=Trypanosoma melophagium TaxID=715481 RepID=UPI00351A043B|nr:Heat shock protein DnaJ [Trypanosoma melophagium]